MKSMLGRLDAAGEQHTVLLSVMTLVVVPLGCLLALPMAFGIYMSPSNPDELGSAHNPLLYLLGALVAIATIAALAATLAKLCAAFAVWRRRLLLVAIVAGATIVLGFAAAVASVAVG
jgi:hypothetical protein